MSSNLQTGQSARKAKLHKHADYQRVYQATRKQFSASMTWFLAARPGVDGLELPSGPRVGLTVGKVIGKAHERNRIKRRMREIVRKDLKELPNGVDLILHPRRSVITADFVKLEAEVLRIFRQAAGQARMGNIPGAAPAKIMAVPTTEANAKSVRKSARKPRPKSAPNS